MEIAARDSDHCTIHKCRSKLFQVETALRSDGFKFEILIGKHERLISQTK